MVKGLNHYDCPVKNTSQWYLELIIKIERARLKGRSKRPQLSSEAITHCDLSMGIQNDDTPASLSSSPFKHDFSF